MLDSKPAITGVVLAGGLGRRMGGVDKGLRPLHGRTMVAAVIERFAPQVNELLINANQNIEIYSQFGYRVVPDVIGGYAGPLAGLPRPLSERRLAELGNRALQALAAAFHDWRVLPAGTEGYRKAEVTAGGVATAELDPRTLEVKRIPGLHFIGESVDVTGWLGGYNFQWAWASGYSTAQAMASVGATRAH